MKWILTWIIFFMSLMPVVAQRQSLDSILNEIQKANPVGKMYDNDIRSMDEAAKGARSWMAPELGTGFWMAPYNTSLWRKGVDGTSGMGQYTISAQQVIPNRKTLDANAAYMGAMSSVAREKKKASLNELYAVAKKSYYEWIIIRKKISIIDRDQRLLELMIQNAEIRYRNGMEAKRLLQSQGGIRQPGKYAQDAGK